MTGVFLRRGNVDPGKIPEKKKSFIIQGKGPQTKPTVPTTDL